MKLSIKWILIGSNKHLPIFPQLREKICYFQKEGQETELLFSAHYLCKSNEWCQLINQEDFLLKRASWQATLWEKPRWHLNCCKVSIMRIFWWKQWKWVCLRRSLLSGRTTRRSIRRSGIPRNHSFWHESRAINAISTPDDWWSLFKACLIKAKGEKAYNWTLS